MVAAVNGHAIGLGLDLACICDVRLAADTAKFASSFIKVGIVPGDGGAWILARAIGLSRASEMILTGDTIDARTAESYRARFARRARRPVAERSARASRDVSRPIRRKRCGWPSVCCAKDSSSA